MTGTTEIVRSFNAGLGIRSRITHRTPLERLVPRVSAHPIEGVLSALLVTLGLLCGALAIAPQQIIDQVPLVHTAVAFFVPFATLFALTDLTFRDVSRVMVQGLVTTLVVGSAALMLY